MSATMGEAAGLVALVIGQDLEPDETGTYRIVRGVAKDRTISTVDTDARHGHKTSARRFDGYKGHVAADPDSEMITDTAVGPANAGDGAMTDQLTRDLDPDRDTDAQDNDTDAESVQPAVVGEDNDTHGESAHPADDTHSEDNGTVGEACEPVDDGQDATDSEDTDGEDGERPAIYGDAAYGSGANLANLERRGIVANTKVQPPASRGGLFTKDAFAIDLDDTVTCPGGHTVAIGRNTDGDGVARFGALCLTCPLRGRCTTAKAGRAVTVSRYERLLAAARMRQSDPAWREDYRATRPKVERKLAHMLRAGRRARRRGQAKVDADWTYTGAGVNLARLAKLGVRNLAGGWQIATT